MLDNHLTNDEEILSDRDMNLSMVRILKTEHVSKMEVLRKIRKYKGIYFKIRKKMRKMRLEYLTLTEAGETVSDLFNKFV